MSIDRSKRASRRPLAALVVACLALAWIQLPASATVSEGSLDPSFASTGQTSTPIGTNTTDRASSVAIQKDGKIVVAGLAHIGTTNEIAVVRYLDDGTLDPSFGSGGKVTTPIGSGALANAVAIQPDGKILVAGYGTPLATAHFAVARYNSDGTLDSTFNGSGIAQISFHAGADSATGVAVQPDGKIVLVGNSVSGGTHLAVARLNSNGTPDSSFGSGGKAEPNVESGAAVGNAVAVESNGKIVIAGGSPNGLLAVRLNSNGSPDTGFSSDGAATVQPQTTGVAYAVALQSNGSITIAGSSSNGTKSNFAVARFTSNGTPDASLSGPGWVITVIGTGNDVARGVNIQPDGKIVVSGTTSDGTHDSFAIARYLTGGALDNNFSGDGKATTQITSNVDNVGVGQAMAANGKPVVVGYVHNATDDFGIARFIGDAMPPTAGVVTGLVRYQTNTAFSFGWTASDDNTGIGRFDLIRSFANYNRSTFSSFRTIFSGAPG
ncbi:MAG TPA: delta-60 repeat domain-containing protein, partial [Actinomycetota bacterium]|nr:delta-60 repeat domain-containing protein [Actinomycetota bacterium]